MSDEQTAVDTLAKQEEIDAARDRYVELALPGELRYGTYWQDLAAGYVSGESAKLRSREILLHLLDLNERLKKIEALLPPEECP